MAWVLRGVSARMIIRAIRPVVISLLSIHCSRRPARSVRVAGLYCPQGGSLVPYSHLIHEDSPLSLLSLGHRTGGKVSPDSEGFLNDTPQWQRCVATIWCDRLLGE